MKSKQHGRNDEDQGTSKYWDRNMLSATLSTTDLCLSKEASGIIRLRITA